MKRQPYTVAKCDEPGGHAWDLFYRGTCIEQGIRTRGIARTKRDKLNAEHREEK